MNPFEMVVLIVGIISVSTVIKAKYGYGIEGKSRRRRWREQEGQLAETDAEADRLRGEVRQLQERIHVLERIVTDGERDSGRSLEREIDALRDRK